MALEGVAEGPVGHKTDEQNGRAEAHVRLLGVDEQRTRPRRHVLHQPLVHLLVARAHRSKPLINTHKTIE